MWLHLGKVDLYYLVVESRRISHHLIIGAEFCRILLGENSNLLTTRLAQVFVGVLVEGEDGASGSQFCSHITDGGLACGRDAVETFAEVFKDGICAALDGQNAENFEDHVFRSCPSREFALKMNTNKTRHLEFPWLSGQHVYRICTAHTYCYHTETSGIGRMRVGSYHHTTREGIILEHHLMDDSSSWTPESNMIFL